jgi:hypothetical protein
MIESIIQGLMPSALWSLLRTVFRKTRQSDPQSQPDQVVIEKLDSSKLSGPFSSVIANPTEAIVLVRDGQVVDVYNEEKLRTLGTGGSLRAAIGMGPEVTALKVDLRPFRVEINFGENAPNVNALPNNFRIQDDSGDLVSATLSIEVAFHPDNAQRALWWSGTDNSVTRVDVQEKLMQPVMSAIQPVIAGSEIKALRTHEASMQFSSEIKSKLEGMKETYGLGIEDISIVWYQTTNEKAASELDEVEFEAEKAKARSETRGHKAANGPYTEIHGDVSNTTNSGMGAVWIIVLVVIVFAGIGAVVYLMGSNA